MDTFFGNSLWLFFCFITFPSQSKRFFCDSSHQTREKERSSRNVLPSVFIYFFCWFVIFIEFSFHLFVDFLDLISLVCNGDDIGPKRRPHKMANWQTWHHLASAPGERRETPTNFHKIKSNVFLFVSPFASRWIAIIFLNCCHFFPPSLLLASINEIIL